MFAKYLLKAYGEEGEDGGAEIKPWDCIECMLLSGSATAEYTAGIHLPHLW